MSISDFVTPKTAVLYLISTGMSKNSVGPYVGVSRGTVFRVLRLPEYYGFHGSVTAAFRAAYVRRRKEVENNAAVRREVD